MNATTVDAERIARTTAMRVERLLPKTRELLTKHVEGAEHSPQEATWTVTEAQLAAIVDEVQQEMRREHNREMQEAEREFSREARDIAAEARWQGQEETRGGCY